MNEADFNEWLGCLSAAEKWLQAAFELMDGIEGYSLGGENAHLASLSAIRALRAVEIGGRSCS